MEWGIQSKTGTPVVLQYSALHLCSPSDIWKMEFPTNKSIIRVPGTIRSSKRATDFDSDLYGKYCSKLPKPQANSN